MLQLLFHSNKHNISFQTFFKGMYKSKALAPRTRITSQEGEKPLEILCSVGGYEVIEYLRRRVNHVFLPKATRNLDRNTRKRITRSTECLQLWCSLLECVLMLNQRTWRAKWQYSYCHEALYIVLWSSKLDFSQTAQIFPALHWEWELRI